MPSFVIGFKCPPAPDGREAERRAIIGDLAAEMLIGESSQLYQRLYEEGVIDADFTPRPVNGGRARAILADVWGTSNGPFALP